MHAASVRAGEKRPCRAPALVPDRRVRRREPKRA
jgi:hypothetical protein